MNKFKLLVGALLIGTTLIAQEEKKMAESAPSPAVSALRLAGDLVKYGYANQSPLSLIQALQIISETPSQKGENQKEGSQADLTKSEGKNGMMTFEVETLLADAGEMAQGDEKYLTLLAEIREKSTSSHRGAVSGPVRHSDAVSGNSHDEYNINFIANSLAEVFVSGDGDTDLDLYIYDSNGNLIEKDADYTDDCYVSWVPKWTGRYKVRIVNRGPVYNRYILLTN